MAVTLSPWPTSAQALVNATECLKQVLPDNLTDERIQRLGATASALVEQYAANAPQAVKDTAVERCAGYLAQQPAAAVRSEKAGDVEVGYAVSNMSVLRHSGAMAILSMYKIRRAGTVG